jgi:hypothetical protein
VNNEGKKLIALSWICMLTLAPFYYGCNSGWCVNDDFRNSNMCSNFPAKLTHPRFTIAEAKPKAKPKPVVEGFDTTSHVVALPSDGDFVFRAIGYDLGSEGEAQWEFCGQSGRLGHEMHFRMRNGTCKGTNVINARNDDCSFVMSVLKSSFLVTHTLSTDSLALVRHFSSLFVFGSSMLVVLTIAIGFVLRRQHVQNRQFTTVDTTEHEEDFLEFSVHSNVELERRNTGRMKIHIAL